MTTDHYDDQVLYGYRLDALKLCEDRRQENNSECVIRPIKAIAVRHEWNLRKLSRRDARLENMLARLAIVSATPIQRYSWPQIEQANFPTIMISPEKSGKSYAYLLYVTASIIDELPATNIEDILIRDVTPFNQTTICNQESKIAEDFKSVDQSNFDFNSLGKSDPNVAPKELATDPSQLLMAHTKYIVVCASEHNIDLLSEQIDCIKSALYGDKVNPSRLRYLPPKMLRVNSNLSEAELAYRCRDSDVIIGAPKILLHCLHKNYIDFRLCRKAFFDDLDMTLQLQHVYFRDLMASYLAIIHNKDTCCTSNTGCDSGIYSPLPEARDPCQLYMFSRKWTDLVKKFSDEMFSQKIILFGSLAEAAVYANLRFDLELYSNDDMKLNVHLPNLIDLHLMGPDEHKLAILFKNDDEAEKCHNTLTKMGIATLFLPEETALMTLNTKQSRHTMKKRAIVLLSDGALDLIFAELTDITHLVHYSMPERIQDFDLRFRLMFKYIRDSEHAETKTTIFMPEKGTAPHCKELYDIISRSNTTLTSTKKTMRDIARDHTTHICWRWASGGVCRLEKLSRKDCFGSYCPDRHCLISTVKAVSSIKSPNCSSSMVEAPSNTVTVSNKTQRWPSEGQVQLTVTHIVSPNEFYFVFEAYRDINSESGKWNEFECTGSKLMSRMQDKLDLLRDTKNYSVPLDDFKKHTVFGVYFQEETKVCRVMLLEDVHFDNINKKLSIVETHIQYSKQCLAVKIDHGIKVKVYLRNLFRLPQELTAIPAQCHRGFYIGVKTINDEPYWNSKATRVLQEQIQTSHKQIVTAWIRLSNARCFWFDELMITRKLCNSDGSRESINYKPYRELIDQGLASKSTRDPNFLKPSSKKVTLSKWQIDTTQKRVFKAFFDSSKAFHSIEVTFIFANLELSVRLRNYKRQLIGLEKRMLEDFEQGRLKRLSYYKTGTYCLAKVTVPNNVITINRCEIVAINSSPSCDTIDESNSCEFVIRCWDYGDKYDVKAEDLYLAPAEYLEVLPLQAIRVKLASLNPNLVKDEAKSNQIQNLVYDFTRDQDDQFVPAQCRCLDDGSVYIFIKTNQDLQYRSLVDIMERDYGIDFITDDDPALRSDVIIPRQESPFLELDGIVECLIEHLTRDIVTRILNHRLAQAENEVISSEPASA